MRMFLILIIMISFSGCNEFKLEDPSAEANVQEIKETVIVEPKPETVSTDLVDWIYSKSILPKSTAKEISEFIYENCKYPHLIHGIIMRESNFKIFSYRKDTKVYGLGQITYDIWKDEIKQFGVNEARDLYDWKKNILVINYIFNKYYEETGDLREALKKYVGEVNSDMSKYCTDILAYVGYLYVLEMNNS